MQEQNRMVCRRLLREHASATPFAGGTLVGLSPERQRAGRLPTDAMSKVESAYAFVK